MDAEGIVVVMMVMDDDDYYYCDAEKAAGYCRCFLGFRFRREVSFPLDECRGRSRALKIIAQQLSADGDGDGSWVSVERLWGA